MKALEEKILAEGEVRPGGILKVDGFLNHRIDPTLSYAMAEEVKRLFAEEGVNKVLTIEASGIAMAVMVAWVFGCPLVFAKKSRTKNIAQDVWAIEIPSFTHGNTNTAVVSKEYLGPGDRVLLIDDFLATGAALVGLRKLVEMAGGTVVGAAVAIEKEFQGGGNALRAAGMRVESLAKIAEMTDNSIRFAES